VSRAELGSARGEVEKCHDGIFQRAVKQSNKGSHVADLSPLKNLPLQRLDLDFKPDRDTALLRSIKTLETINGKPADEFCKEVEAYQARAKNPLDFETPGFDPWFEQTAALPAEEQVKAVATRLRELNPGFDGKVTDLDGQAPPKIENGVVTELRFVTDNVTDISPVRALSKLKALWCYGSYRASGRLSNLSPLKGMPLTFLISIPTRLQTSPRWRE
jgi:hypothetical protein